MTQEERLARRDALRADRDALQADRDALQAERDAAQAALREMARQLQAIQQTTGYRLLERARRTVRWLFPPGRLRSLPYRALLRLLRWLSQGGRGDTQAGRR